MDILAKSPRVVRAAPRREVLVKRRALWRRVEGCMGLVYGNERARSCRRGLARMCSSCVPVPAVGYSCSCVLVPFVLTTLTSATTVRPMSRRARLVIPGCPHHVVHRGNRGEAVFRTPDDHHLYLRWLRECAAKHGVRIWAYCLMSNHVHLVAVPEEENSLALAIGQAHMRYSRWVNHRQGWSGHLWANRFYSTPMDEPHLWAAIRYVELNPQRAGLVARAEEHHWSSAPAHVYCRSDAVLSRDLPAGGPKVGRVWREWLAEGLEEATLEAIRRCTSTGYPLGSREFVCRVIGGDS